MLTHAAKAPLKFETLGDPKNPAILMIAGLQQQLIDWPQSLLKNLSERGFYVIYFDNRDVGESPHYTHLKTPNVVWQIIKNRLGWAICAPYTINDMAQDALALLDYLTIQQAHILGWSMGGMIAQRLCLLAPERSLSLTCIMSSSGPPNTPTPILKALGSKPRSQNFDDRVAHACHIYQLIAGPHYPIDPQSLKERVTRSLQRHDQAKAPESGSSRQMLAIMADRKRPYDIHKITIPTLVIHGKADPLVPFANGADIATKISQAKLIAYQGMGHDFPESLIPDMSTQIIAHVSQPQ